MALRHVNYRFTVDDYNRMAETGILKEDARVELIEGEIKMMSPIGSRHASTVDRSDRALKRLLGDSYIVRVQGPILLDDYSEPQLDLAVLHFRDDFYAGGHPTPADVLLVIEVADSTLQEDRKVKMPLYARAGIPEAWLVDLRPKPSCATPRRATDDTASSAACIAARPLLSPRSPTCASP